MTQTQMVKTDPEDSEKMYNIQISIDTRSAIISSMLANNMNTASDAFHAYQEDLESLRKLADTTKNDIYAKYVEPVIKNKSVTKCNWSLNPATSSIIIEYDD